MKNQLFSSFASLNEDTYSQIVIPGLIYNIGTGFTLSDYIILFDETEHVFVYGSRSGQTSFKVIEEFESTNLGSYVPVWGTPNRNVNNPFFSPYTKFITERIRRRKWKNI